MKITKKKLKRVIREELARILDEQMVPMYLRGQGDRSAFASGIFEDDENVDEEEVPLGYGTAAEREKRRLAGIEGDESAFGEQNID